MCLIIPPVQQKLVLESLHSANKQVNKEINRPIGKNTIDKLLYVDDKLVKIFKYEWTDYRKKSLISREPIR